MSPAGQHVLLGLRFQELSWDHTSPEEEESVLWLEFDGDNEGTPVNKLLKIYSKQVVVGVACTEGGDGGRGGCAQGVPDYWRLQAGWQGGERAAEGLGTRGPAPADQEPPLWVRKAWPGGGAVVGGGLRGTV